MSDKRETTYLFVYGFTGFMTSKPITPNMMALVPADMQRALSESYKEDQNI